MDDMSDADELMERFENILDQLDERVSIGSTYEELQGVGTEYIVIDGFVIAKFFKGKLVCDTLPVGNTEVTAA